VLGGLFSLEGPPKVLVSDNAEVFQGEQFRAMLRTWKVEQKFIPTYSPWYGGFYESSHKCLVKTLAGLLLETGASDWTRALSLATYLYNCRPYDHSVDSGLNPHEVFRGRRTDSIWKNGALDIEECLRLTDDLEGTTTAALETRRKILEWYEEVWKDMRKSSAKEVARRQKGTDRFRVGSRVYVYIPRLKRRKTDPKWDGPYVIEEKVSAVKWRVNGYVEHAFNLKLAHDQPDVGNADVPIPETRSVIPGRRARLGALLAYQPRGDVLDWI